MSLTGKDIVKLRSLYESVYEPKPEETELMTEQTYKECLETVILEAIEESGLLDIEFEDEELQMRLVEEVLSENFLKNQIKKFVTSKPAQQKLKKLGMDALKATGISLGGAGVVDTRRAPTPRQEHNKLGRHGTCRVETRTLPPTPTRVSASRKPCR